MAPRFPEFVYPAIPGELVPRVDPARHDAAWQALQRGDLQAAERAFAGLLAREPGFYPAETGLGYVELARPAAERALAHFDAALARAPQYAPALAGRGEALLLSDRVEDALASFEAAAAADATLAGVRRRVEVLRFRVVEADIARAREAAEAGRYAAALDAYERALQRSPDSGFLHREAAAAARSLGRLDRAADHARRATELDPADARAFVLLGEVEAARGNHGAAAAAFERAYALEPGGRLAARLAEARARAADPEVGRKLDAIARAPAITRGDLAALVAIHLGRLLERAPRREGVLVTDARGHWAAPFILAVARAGVMEVYPNYTFQPAEPVTRGELADVVARLLGLVAAERPELAERWRRASVTLPDVPAGHLSYPAVAAAVASGVMPPLPGGTFQVARPVTGAEARAVIDRVAALAPAGS